MKVKDLKRKLDLLSENAQDFEILIDAGDVNLLSLEKVYVGGAWNIVLSADEDDIDVEDEDIKTIGEGVEFVAKLCEKGKCS